MRTHTPALALTLATAALWAPRAQATVNIEKYRLALAEDGATAGVSLGVASKTGNVDYFEGSVSGTAGVRRGAHLLLGVVSGKYAAKRTGDDRVEAPGGTLRDSDARYANKLLGALRYNLSLHDRLAWELFTQVQYDEFLRMDLRTLGGTGLRVALHQAEHTSVHVGTGYMLEYESQDPDVVVGDATTTAHRSTSYICFALEPVEKLTISSTSYIQPRFTQLSDYRVLNESSVTVALGEYFSLSLAFTLRHDSDPAQLVADEPPLVPTDTTITNKISVDF